MSRSKIVLFVFAALLGTQADAAIYTSIQPINSFLPRQYAPGSSVTLSVAIQPLPTGQYQWWHNESPLSGATQPTLTLTNLAPANSGNYQLRITNGAVIEVGDTITINVLPLPPSPADRSFSVAPLDPPRVASVAHFADDGSMIVSLTNLTTETARRLSSSGELVSSFSLPESAGVVLAGFPDGSLITAQAPFRVSATGSARPITLPAGFDATKRLTAASTLAGGKFLVAQSKLLARFNADGTLDNTFEYSDSDNPLISIDSIVADPTGRMYLGGTVRNPVPGNLPFSWSVVYRLTTNGRRDTAFAAQYPILYGSLLVMPLSNGRVLYYSAYHGYRTWHLLLDDGTPDPAWSGSTTFTERSPVIDRIRDEIYIITPVGKLLRYRVTSTGMTEDESFYAGYTSFQSNNLSIDPTGRLLVYGDFSGWEGHPTSRIARLNRDAVAGAMPPNATIQTNSTSPARDSTVVLNSHVTGTGPFMYQWLALDGQSLPAETTSEKLTIPVFSTAHFGRYQLRVTAVGGATVLSNVAEFTFSPQQPYLANLSGRARTGSGENTAIAGISTKIYAGARGLSTLLRGIGPALGPLGVADYLPNPAIDVFNSSGTLIANNDQWEGKAEIVAAASAAGAFALGGASNDAALLHTFPTGNVTLMLRNQGPGDGIGLIEVYQLAPLGNEPSYQALLNLSLRARTAPGDGVAIAGFVIVDPQGFGRTARVLLRAVGPSLAAQGIVEPLNNPVMTLYKSTGEMVAQNDDWTIGNNDSAAIASVMKQVGAFELDSASKDSALLLDLPAGAYSIHANGGTGVVLLEIYLVR